ncbi:MAG TPA: hypothetical protein VGF97_04105 [Rhizomicrobium sp.]|jgi:hypothetical protein
MFTKQVAALALAACALMPLGARAADVSGEISNAATHAGLAASASDIAGVHMHLHHAVNCLVGPNGAGFDAKELNPCANSGGGAIPDSSNATVKQALLGAVAKANSGIAATDLATAQKDASETAAMLKAVK